MDKTKLREIIKEEIQNIKENSISQGFQKAVENYKKVMIKKQDLQKAFLSAKNPAAKEKAKQAIIKFHPSVVKAEKEFKLALQNEPVDL